MDAGDEYVLVRRLRTALGRASIIPQGTNDELETAFEKVVEVLNSASISAEESLRAFALLWDESLKILYGRRRRRAHYAGARGDGNKRFPRRLRKPHRHSPRWSVAATGE